MQARHLDAKLSPVSRFWQGDMAQVKLDVEIGVLDPVGSVEAARYFYQACAKQRQVSQAAFETGDHVLEAHETARRRGWIVDAQAANVLRRVCLFQIDECRIKNS